MHLSRICQPRLLWGLSCHSSHYIVRYRDLYIFILQVCLIRILVPDISQSFLMFTINSWGFQQVLLQFNVHVALNGLSVGQKQVLPIKLSLRHVRAPPEVCCWRFGQWTPHHLSLWIRDWPHKQCLIGGLFRQVLDHFSYPKKDGKSINMFKTTNKNTDPRPDPRRKARTSHVVTESGSTNQVTVHWIFCWNGKIKQKKWTLAFHVVDFYMNVGKERLLDVARTLFLQSGNTATSQAEMPRTCKRTAPT